MEFEYDEQFASGWWISDIDDNTTAGTDSAPTESHKLEEVMSMFKEIAQNKKFVDPPQKSEKRVVTEYCCNFYRCLLGVCTNVKSLRVEISIFSSCSSCLTIFCF